ALTRQLNLIISVFRKDFESVLCAVEFLPVEEDILLRHYQIGVARKLHITGVHVSRFVAWLQAIAFEFDPVSRHRSRLVNKEQQVIAVKLIAGFPAVKQSRVVKRNDL